MNKAIQVVLDTGNSSKQAVMIAHCMGERSIERKLADLPDMQPARALAQLMCHHNKWELDLVAGILPNGDEVFCFRNNWS